MSPKDAFRLVFLRIYRNCNRTCRKTDGIARMGFMGIRERDYPGYYGRGGGNEEAVRFAFHYFSCIPH